MGRSAAGGRCTECRSDELYALQMCKRCYQREYMRKQRKKKERIQYLHTMALYRAENDRQSG